MQPRIAVVYLMWLPYDIAHMDLFIESYKKYESGCAHDLIVVFNGVASHSQIESHLKLLTAKLPEGYTWHSREIGQDIDIYFWISSVLKNHSHLLFLNTYSRILHHKWLNRYMLTMMLPGVGMVGATGSWQSIYSDVFIGNRLPWNFRQPFFKNFEKYKLFLKAFFYWRILFKSFPNPHIRTNAFFVDREHFLKMKYREIPTKFKAYQYESGRKSITNHFLKTGYKVKVVDKDGTSYEIKDWKKSNTFRRGDQENLLIADNQTDLYSKSTEDERRQLSVYAWGKNE
jgi:hypothetical protein